MTTHMVTVISGGTRGIGAATARQLASLGHDLVLGYRTDAEAARALATELEALGSRVVLIESDVTEDAGIEALFDGAMNSFGHMDCFVNNAGATMHIGDLAETPVATVRRVIDLNLTAAVLAARGAVRAFLAANRPGVIVNVSSTSATSGSPGSYVHYAAAKAGVDALTVGLAAEVAARGIRVVGVSPGLTQTRIHADAGVPDRARDLGAGLPLGRAGEPEEVAAAIVWLLSPSASYTGGTILRVAGAVR